jgi:hypothetical protein
MEGSQREVKGMYTSSSNVVMGFQTAALNGKMAIIIEGRSASLQNLNLRSGYNSSSMFYVSFDEYNDFLQNILRGDDDLPKKRWAVKNKNGEIVFIPGTWKEDMGERRYGCTLSGGARGARKKCKSYQRRSRVTGHCKGQKKRKSKSKSRTSCKK